MSRQRLRPSRKKEAQVPGHPKTDIVVSIVRPVVVAVGSPAILWIIVPGTAAQNKGTDLPTEDKEREFICLSAMTSTTRRSYDRSRLSVVRSLCIGLSCNNPARSPGENNSATFPTASWSAARQGVFL